MDQELSHSTLAAPDRAVTLRVCRALSEFHAIMIVSVRRARPAGKLVG
ncbi:MAG: hypothetical protein MUO54_08990 [Anaerolineales bacterium]|nr:hypothetical protein [Anaerolineales bacterium]